MDLEETDQPSVQHESSDVRHDTMNGSDGELARSS